MSCKVDFPTTPEAFISYHEAMRSHLLSVWFWLSM